MKNKEITIYELMGLIKDNKAPYEIIYAGTKYYISLENYYKSEDGTSLLESIFNDYNDYIVNDILNRIQLQAENMKINAIDINKGCQCKGVNK